MRARHAALLLLLPLLLVVAQAGAAAVAGSEGPTIGDKPPAVTSSTSATFSFTVPGAASSECRLDGGAFAPCTSPITYSGLAEGSHTFAVRSVGEVEPGEPGEPVTHTWRVDTTAPALALVAPAHESLTSDAGFEIAGTAGIAEGDGATVQIQVREGTGGGQPIRRLTAEVSPATGAWSVRVAPPLTEGTYNVRAEQTDWAGNSVETPRHTVTVDLTAPGPPSLGGPAARTGSNSAQITFTHAEGGLTFLCRLDAGAEEACTSPKGYTGLADGAHSVAVRARDAAGNLGAPATRNWVVDTTPPSVAIVSPAQGSLTSSTAPTISGTGGTAPHDATSVSVSVHAGSNATGPALRTLAATVGATGAWAVTVAPALPPGEYTAVARQQDDIPNTGVSAARTFTIDTSVPNVTLVAPVSGSVMTLRSPVFQGTADQPAVAVDVYAGAAPAGPPLHTIAVSVPGGTGPWSATLTATLADGSYTAVARATNGAGTTGSSNAVLFHVDNAPPGPVTDLKASAGNGIVRLSWKPPGDWNLARVVVRRAARGKSNWSVIFRSATATSFADRSVANEREYVYRVTAVDTAGNVSPFVGVTARPSAFFAPAWGAVVSNPPTLRWTGVRGARYYNVQLWQGGRKVLSRWPTRASFAVPRTWRFQGRSYSLKPGTYFAYAWPGIGPKSAGRYGRLVGSTKFVVR